MVSDDKASQLQNQPQRRHASGHYKGFISSSASIYAGLFLVIIALVAAGYKTPERNETLANAVPNSSIVAAAEAESDNSTGSIDQLVATKAAAHIASSAELPVAPNVENLSVSLSVEREMAQNSEGSNTEKPRVIEADGVDRGIKKYKTKRGDTVTKIAKLYGISAETVRWANDLTSDALEPGKTLTILPVTGIQYTTESGDTIDAIAKQFKTSTDRIVSFNDLELSKDLKPGTKLIIPGGILPSNQRPGYSAPIPTQSQVQYVPNYGSGFGGKSWYIKTGTSGNNGGYAFGNCTAYAFDRRAQLGKPVGRMWGNASTWAAMAQAQGYRVDNVPAVGAVMQNGGGYGHVAIVEEVMKNGDVRISEMNAYVSGGGFNIVSGRIIPASSARSYAYIH